MTLATPFSTVDEFYRIWDMFEAVFGPAQHPGTDRAYEARMADEYLAHHEQMNQGMVCLTVEGDGWFVRSPQRDHTLYSGALEVQDLQAWLALQAL